MLLKKEDMNKIPKVSIIVPIYNVEKYLDRCIQSLVNQTLNDIEIILVDDGSPDNCPQMCDEYAQKDNRIKVIHKQNAGLGYARNSGLDIATGEYVAFVDSDDYVDTSMYKKLYNETINHKYDIVYCGFIVEKKDKSTYTENTKDRDLKDSNEILELCRNMIACNVGVKEERSESMAVWHGIYKKEIIDKHNVKFESERNILSEDIVFDAIFIPLCKSIRTIQDALYIHCFNNESLSKTFNANKIEKNIYLYYRLNEITKAYGLNNFNLNIVRFFIGYNRSFFRSIFNSNIDNKKELCEKIFNLNIWNHIFAIYPIQTLPLFHKLVIFCVRKKNFYLLSLIYYFRNKL